MRIDIPESMAPAVEVIRVWLAEKSATAAIRRLVVMQAKDLNERNTKREPPYPPPKHIRPREAVKRTRAPRGKGA